LRKLTSAVFRKYTGTLLFIPSWIMVAVVIPELQQGPSISDLTISAAVGCIFIAVLRSVENAPFMLFSTKKLILLTSVIGLCFTGLFLIASSRYSDFYVQLSRFGSDAMTTGKDVILFGDFRHLTDAASCTLPTNVGLVNCDLWLRPFNQNPDLPLLLNYFHLYNSLILGFAIFMYFMVTVCVYVNRFLVAGPAIILTLISPVVVLAIDRGNEILTIALILSALIFLESKSKKLRVIAPFFILFAVIFKVWPILFLPILIFRRDLVSRLSALFVLIVSLIYWAVKLNQLNAMLAATGTPPIFNLSFGLKPFFDTDFFNPTSIFLFMTLLALTILFIKFDVGNAEKIFDHDLRQHNDVLIFSSLIFTYTLVWLIGNSYIYRIIVVLPLVLLLSQRKYLLNASSANTRAVVLGILFVSKLPITFAFSGALSLTFMYFLLKNRKMLMPNRLNLHFSNVRAREV